MARILGLDVGSRRVGVALSDATCSIAAPYATITHRGVRRLVAELVAVCRAEQVCEVVVGIPRQADGRAGAAARLPKRVAEELRHAGYQVDLWDERGTTVDARRLLAGNVPARRARARGMVDRIAAALILQSYLETVRPRVSEGAASPDRGG
ncbi:MAG: Holliday junction resolvase RuvX [Spirochaetaceae bacterium]|nr:Holliday junction resolvase RuvX [Spirochaetaceae bacterium]